VVDDADPVAQALGLLQSRLWGSTPTVGSSRIRRVGSWSNPMPMLSRRFIPPEKSPAGSSARSINPIVSRTSSTLAASDRPPRP
jgi:hypothetical protein